MNWIIFGVVFILTQTSRHKSSDLLDKLFGSNGLAVVATPVPPNDPFLIPINPYIRHWEAARFDVEPLKNLHEQRRRKRDTVNNNNINGDNNATRSGSNAAYATNRFGDGPANTFNLSFFAHNRQFNLVLREDPRSIFSPDVEIENTLGPLAYDVSRVFTGTLADDDSAVVHGVLTEDNLFDGSIITQTENYYIEPAHKYSIKLNENGIHSIVYKTSDVLDALPKAVVAAAAKATAVASSSGDDASLVSSTSIDGGEHHCASERLRRKVKNEFKRRRKSSLSSLSSPSTTSSSPSSLLPQSTSAPSFDVDNANGKRKTTTPKIISDSKSSFNKIMNEIVKLRSKRWLPDELSESKDPPLPLDLDVPYNDDFNVYSRKNNNNHSLNKNSRNRPDDTRKNILIGDYNSNNEFILRNSTHFNSNNNILSNTFDNGVHVAGIGHGNGGNYQNGKYAINTNSSSRPSHKTHVEILTKNGATKKPIIGSSYNPTDTIITRSNFHHHINPAASNHIKSRTTADDGVAAKSLYDRKSTCMLYLQADHTFYQKMGSEEASIEAITRHVQRANSIYKNTDFNGDGKPDNITFMIKRIKVHTSKALNDKLYRFPGSYGVEKFLELFSEEDYDAFCLAYMFTYRDFEMGTLGLAWTGDLKNAGGVCEKNGHYRGSLKSLNTGIVTLLNYGKHVPPAVSHVTLAHEIGHNFGSPHDPEQCTPGGEDGNYIMFARATSGDKRNNNKFSPCSLKAIEPVLNAKARSAKGCFTEPQQAICGNGVVDPGEECDCGWEEDCKDTCCFPMTSHPLPNQKPCTLTSRASCSPSQGPCCTTECTLKFGDRCRDDNGCRDPSFCDGHMPYCPPSVNKANKTICNKESVCYMGECTGSICLAYGLESCQCIPTEDDPKTKACELCCKLPGEGNPCKSSFAWNELPYDVPDMYAKPGTPCNDYNGYCDVYQKCRDVDPSGPWATLRKLLLSEENIESVKSWIISNWFTIVFVVVVIAVLLILSARLMGGGVRRKQKSVTIIHSATTETVRLPEDSNGVIVHTAIRTKVPFKKKVRGERSSKSKTAAANVGLKSSNKKKSTSAGFMQAAAIAAGSTNHVFKRQTSSADDAHKLEKKKKRTTVPNATNDEQPSTSAQPDPTTRKLKKSQSKTKVSSKHKEIIDYSKRTAVDESQSNAIGKVHQWLQDSPITQPPKEQEHVAKTRQMNKSQSTPERLAQRAPKKSKSAANLDEKVKLQVVYKPPFKFSLKLSKNPAVKTKVVGSPLGTAAELQRSKRRSRADKARQSLAAGKVRRSALLIRSKGSDETDGVGLPFNLLPGSSNTEDRQQLMPPQEPNYETLNTRRDSSAGAKATVKPEPINTNTFRINKSASGSNVLAQHSKLLHNNSPSNTFESKSSGSRGSTTNLNKLGSLNAHPSGEYMNVRGSSNRASALNLSKQFGGSSQNLMRSSTTNLSKANSNRNSFDAKRGFYDMSRSSTTNLSKDRRQGSQLNLLKHQHLRGASSKEDIMLPAVFASASTSNGTRSRRNSSAGRAPDTLTKTTSIPRVPSNSNLKIPSLRHGGTNNNIPRASLNMGTAMKHNANAFLRQTSLQAQANSAKGTSSPRHSIADYYPSRPHTAECNADKKFDWSPMINGDKLDKKNESLPSDLEVMVSDIDTLVTNDK